MMRSVLDEPVINGSTAQQTNRTCQQDEDEAEIARRIERGINEAKTAISEKLEDGKAAAERLLKHGRYAVEDGVSELAHRIKKHPIGFLGIAFAAGALLGLLLSQSSRGPDADDAV